MMSLTKMMRTMMHLKYPFKIQHPPGQYPLLVSPLNQTFSFLCPYHCMHHSKGECGASCTTAQPKGKNHTAASLQASTSCSKSAIANLRMPHLLTPPSQPRSFGSKPPLPHPPPNLTRCDPKTLCLASNVVMELGPPFVVGGLIFVQCGYPSIPSPALDSFLFCMPILHPNTVLLSTPSPISIKRTIDVEVRAPRIVSPSSLLFSDSST